MNFSVLVPEGTTNHDDPKLVCVLPRWHDYIAFFFTNYVAHAATLVAFPGQSVSESIAYSLAALLLPASGILRVVRLFFLRPGMVRDPLRRAARAGALCMVLKKAEPPEPPAPTPATPPARHNEVWFPLMENPESPATDTATPKPDATPDKKAPRPWWRKIGFRRLSDNCYIHGRLRIPSGYFLVEVPANLPLRWRQTHLPGIPRSRSTIVRDKHFLASSYNVPKILFSLIQSVWATVTLYRARGNQIDTFGYAAFGLTVAPYAFMSVVNIFANLVMPEYPAMFIVHTPDLDEAVDQGGQVEGVVAEVDMAELRVWKRLGKVNDGWLYKVTALLCLFMPLAIIGGLSRFTPGTSTTMQRGFIMSWYIVSIAFGVIPHWQGRESHQAWLAMFWLFAAPAVGGMVVVGKEISEYGVCMKVL